MVGDGIQHGRKGDDMASHDEDGEDYLAQTKQLAAKAAHEDLTGICEVMDMRVSLTELRDGVPRVESDYAKPNDDDNSTIGHSVSQPSVKLRVGYCNLKAA